MGALGAVAAWAAYSFMSTGSQPAEVLPDNTLGYVSIDLDPSGGQKIEALRTLNKFPAFERYVGINPDDDLRKEIVTRLLDESDCDLDYAKDFEPWVGDRAAMAALDFGEDEPTPVFVVQVKDGGKADAGLKKIADCDEGDEGGWRIEGDWAVIAESDAIADKVVDAADKASLADDDDFVKWTGEAGDAGVVTLYAGPSVGAYILDNSDAFEGLLDSSAVPGAAGEMGSQLAEMQGELEAQLRDFAGAAAIVRFEDGGVQLHFATAQAKGMSEADATTKALVENLPGDTAALIAMAFPKPLIATMLDSISSMTGAEGGDFEALVKDWTGLDVPEDIETLFGDAIGLVVGGDLDPAVFFSGNPDGLPVAVKIKGDPDRVDAVLEKLRALAGPDLLASDADGDSIVIGPNAQFREKVLDGGDLSKNKVFADVVPEADKALMVTYINVDELEDAIADMADGEDQEVLDNIKVLSGLGFSAWIEGDVAHGMMRIGTN